MISGIQNGDSTHHQLQSITPHNFNTINATNNTSPKFKDTFCMLLLILYIFIHFYHFHKYTSILETLVMALLSWNP